MMLATLLLAAQTVVAPKVAAVVWDYPDAIASEMVFVVKVDDGAPVTLASADSKIETDPAAGAGNSTYAYPLPALKVTEHTVTVKACSKYDATICAPDQAVSFRLIVMPLPVLQLRAK